MIQAVINIGISQKSQFSVSCLPLDAPEDVGDSHVVVVDDVGQVVRGEPVRLQDDRVTLDGK